MDWIDQALASVFGSKESSGEAPEGATTAPPSPDMAWYPNTSASSVRPSLKIAAQPKPQTQKAPTSTKPNSFETVFNKLVNAESRGRHTGKDGELLSSPVGAKGITQVMGKTGKDPGYGVKPLADDSEKEYLRFGKDYLRAMVDKFGGDMEKAVAAYNAGPASVEKASRAAAKSGNEWWTHLPKKSETLPYMTKILGRDYAQVR